MTGSFLAFLGVSILVIVTPGPDTALTIRNTLIGGRGAGAATAAGVAIGQAIWALATALGIGALLAASEPLFLAVKYAGAAYLIWLGVEALRTAVRRQTGGVHPPMHRLAAARLAPAVALRQGVISNLGNPKMVVFFASLLPQFAPANGASFASLLALGLIFCGLTLAWLALYALAVAKAGSMLLRPRVRRWIEGVTGTVLIALGLRIATEGR